MRATVGGLQTEASCSLSPGAQHTHPSFLRFCPTSHFLSQSQESHCGWFWGVYIQRDGGSGAATWGTRQHLRVWVRPSQSALDFGFCPLVWQANVVEDAEAKETESLPSGTPSLEEGQSCVNHQTPWPIVSLVKGRECSERVQRWEGTSMLWPPKEFLGWPCCLSPVTAFRIRTRNADWPCPDWGGVVAGEARSPLNFLGLKRKVWVWSGNERWECSGHLRLFFLFRLVWETV